MRLIVDSREPDPHPWVRHFSADVRVEVGTLETGDLCLAALQDGAVIERKTVSDFLGCVGANRERFERELKRSRYCGRFAIIVEGALSEVLHARRAMSEPAILGTVAAWSRRFCPILFAGSERLAAHLAESLLRCQIREADRMSRCLAASGSKSRPAAAA